MKMRTHMMRRILSHACTAVVAAGCVSLSGNRSMVTQHPEVTISYSKYQALEYTPPDWPQRELADVYVPDGDGPYPGVLVIHGGGWVTGERSIMDRQCQRLARAGYVVANVDYRLAPKYHFPAQLEDLRAAMRWMRANAARLKLAPDRIGAWGYSAGGHLAALLATDGEASGARVKAAVAGGLPSNLSDFPNGPFVLALMGVTRDTDPAAWAAASPYALASVDDAPLFIYHGTWDTTVRVEQAEKMAAALAAVNAPYELYLWHGSGHNTTFLFGFGAETAAIRFLDRYLRN